MRVHGALRPHSITGWRRVSLTAGVVVLCMAANVTQAGAGHPELGAKLFGQAISAAALPQPVIGPGFEGADIRRAWQTSAEAGQTLLFQSGAGRGGSVAAVAQVGPQAAVSWPNFGQTLNAPPPGTLLHFTAWVRTEDVRDGYGAYLGIDYHRANGERITWSQSGSLRGSNGWTRLDLYGEVPENTATITLRLLLHGRGTAWFDGASCEAFPPQAAAPASFVRLKVTDEVVQAGLLGFGVENNPFAFDQENALTERDRALITERLRALRPRWVRVFTDTRWWAAAPGGPYRFDMPAVQALLEDLRLYDELGTQINLVMWRPTEWSPEAFPQLTAAMAALIEWLRGQGIDHIAALTLYNEPDQEFRGSPAEYVALYRQLSAALADRGLGDITLVGADATQHGDRFFDAVAEPLRGRIGMLSFHEYVNYRASLRIPLLHAARQVQRAREAGTPAVYVWEFNLTGGDGAGTFSPGRDEEGRLLPERYPTALKLVAYALQALQAGVQGLAYWEAFDMVYPGGYAMSFGLWGPAAEGAPLRPVYYAYQLLSRLVEPGAAIRRIEAEPAGALITLAVANPDGSQVLYLLNPWDEPVQAEVRLPAAGARVARYTLEAAAVMEAMRLQTAQLPAEAVTLTRSVFSVRVPAEGLLALVTSPME